MNDKLTDEYGRGLAPLLNKIGRAMSTGGLSLVFERKRRRDNLVCPICEDTGYFDNGRDGMQECGCDALA